MDTFSFLWGLLIVIIIISNMYLVLKYFLDRFLLKNNQKIKFPLPLMLVLLINIFFDILNDFLKYNGSYEFIKILTLSRVEPFIFYAFWASSLLIILILLYEMDSSFISQNLNFLIFCALIGLLSGSMVEGIGNIIFREAPPFFSFLAFERKIFLIYRKIVFPGIYLVSFVLFWFVSKRKTCDENDYNNKIKALNILRDFALYLYLFYVFGMIYLKLKYAYFYVYDPGFLLINILANSFALILLYIGISYYISNKNNKNVLFSNLFKKAYFLSVFFSVSILSAYIWSDELQELKIDISIIIITAILTAVITCIINIYINRYFSSKN